MPSQPYEGFTRNAAPTHPRNASPYRYPSLLDMVQIEVQRRAPKRCTEKLQRSKVYQRTLMETVAALMRLRYRALGRAAPADGG